MKNLKLIPVWAWVSLAVVVVGLALWSGDSDNGKCSGCGCDAGCCDSGVCAIVDCSCSCKK